MANDNTITVAFEGDTSDLKAALDDVNNSFRQIEAATYNSMSMINLFFGTMTQASDTAVKGILLGTQTWQQAMARAFSSMLASFVNTMIVNPLLRWTQLQLEMTLLTQASNADREASNQAAAVADSASDAPGAAAKISSDAALAYGGVYAFLAPEMGPAAAGPASAAEAQVLGQMGMASLDVGAWNIPQNMPAFLHAGEMVIPADFASGLRGGGGLGGDTYTINISAIDTQTGAQFLKNNASVIASTLSSQVRNFNKSVPAWRG